MSDAGREWRQARFAWLDRDLPKLGENLLVDKVCGPVLQIWLAVKSNTRPTQNDKLRRGRFAGASRHDDSKSAALPGQPARFVDGRDRFVIDRIAYFPRHVPGCAV